MKTKLFILFFIILTIKLEALNSPELRCIAVNNNGSVTLTWTTPTDITGFDSYHIFKSNTLNGTYLDIGSIANVNLNTFTDITVNANSQSYFYYVNCLSTSATYTAPFDTLQSILLNVTNVLGNANLVWNPIHIPALTSTELYNNINRQNKSLLIWQFLDSTLATQYNNIVNVCHDTLNYYVEIGDASGCVSISSIDGDLFVDQNPPIPISFDTVSVDNIISQVVLGWQPSPSIDTKGYYICRSSGGSPCLTLTTVLGRFNTYYVDLTSTPNTSSFTYRIAAFDSCGNISVYSDNQNSMLLQSSEDVCNDKIELNWNSYINMNPQLLGYRVMLSINGGTYNSIATLNTNVLSYTYTGLIDNTDYCFYIQAYDNSNAKTSSSNIKCHHIILAHNPSFLYIRHVSVVNNVVEIKVYTDTAVQINGYNLLRSETPTGPFVQIINLTYNSLPNFVVVDNNVNVMNQIYYYKIEEINSCGAIGITSNTAHTILLTTKTIDNFTNELSWNQYGDWAGNVESYDIYRSNNGGSSFNFVKNINAGSSTYTFSDDVSNFTTGQGEFFYYVVAKEYPNFTYPFTEESYSNISSVEQTPYMYIPNAICPQGLNREFKPVAGFISEKNYMMQIYNRFGQLIFETDNPSIGWDGKQKNEYVQSGVYVYLISYVMPSTQVVQRKGHVTVIY